MYGCVSTWVLIVLVVVVMMLMVVRCDEYRFGENDAMKMIDVVDCAMM